MASDDRAIIDEFVIESREHLAEIENQLLAIEAAGADIDVALVNQVFRAIHSIKGAAGFLGFSTLGQLAHELETVLNLVRNREIVPDGKTTNVMLKASDTLSGMIEDIDNSNEVNISEHLAALERIVSRELAEDEPMQADPTPTACEAPVAEAEDLQQPMPAEATPVVEAAPEATSAPAPEAVPESAPSVSAPEVVEAVQETAAASPSTKPVAPETSIRVAVSVLDNLMNLAGELVLSRNQLLQAVGAKGSDNLDGIAARVDQVTSDLQEAIMQARMQPVGTVFNKFPRIVRDLSATLKKQCDLRVEGSEVELDKSIIEAINDPLTHLIRNAVDHGIESPDSRAAANKPAKGTIVLRAFHQAGKVNIAITDNGRGIDAARLKQKAVQRGVISADYAREMSEREAVRLIFRPAFSTAEQVSDVSGRGVGMDVVKTNIERLGGTVSVDTKVGVGTTVNIRLPLTLAIIPSLVVWAGGRRFASPQAGIRELVRVRANELAAKVQRVKGAEVFRLRGQLIPLLRLADSLGLNKTADTDADSHDTSKRAMSIIVVESGNLCYGIVVDGLHDSEEIVVKPLGSHMQDCPFLAGATILGDGAVAMILDVTGIAAHSNLALPEEEEQIGAEEAGTNRGDETQTMLLFRNEQSERFGIPMQLIDRVERIRTQQIDSVGGRLVLQYRGASLPLVKLENQIKARPAAATDKVYVAVFKVQKREFGLVVPELVDIREVSTAVDTVTFVEPGVMGSLEIDGVATRLLDLHQLVVAAHPEWFQNRPAAADDDESENSRIILAEDSSFFRKQLAGFLEADGYEVVACEDGQVAWDTMQQPDQHFDLMVTDLEMPNMNGLELASRTKHDPRWGHLPVIAVTSLASEEDVRRGKEAGVDEYHVKLDREALLETVAHYVRGRSARAR